MDVSRIPTPCYVVDGRKIEANCRVLASVREKTGVKILLALKAFALFRLFPVMRRHLDGACASGFYEAKLAREEFGGEVHVYSPAFREGEIESLLPVAHYIIFNSLGQWRRFRELVRSHTRRIRHGLRINPEYSEVKVELYNPCAPNSRLGVKREALEGEDLEGVTGFLSHTMCEQDSDALERTAAAIEKKFGGFLDGLEWFNFGGGQHITRPGYDTGRLCRVIESFQSRHPNLQIYLEPGEAAALDAGVLVASVLDVSPGNPPAAILDTSAETHMPDVLAMPYRPEVRGAGRPGEYPHTFRLAGVSCLAGDVIGDYSFPRPLRAGERLIFQDMAHYTMVKNTTFNGVPLPAIAVTRPETGEPEIIRQFSYEDYRNRLS